MSIQEPSSLLANELKFNADSSVQPKTTAIQEPSLTVAFIS